MIKWLAGLLTKIVQKREEKLAAKVATIVETVEEEEKHRLNSLSPIVFFGGVGTTTLHLSTLQFAPHLSIITICLYGIWLLFVGLWCLDRGMPKVSFTELFRNPYVFSTFIVVLGVVIGMCLMH